MTTICLMHRKPGFNSTRLILNAIIDMVEDKTHTSWLIEVSPEMHMQDVADAIVNGLGYDAVAKRSERPNGIVVDSITLEIEE